MEKWIGAVLVFLSCGFCGFAAAQNERRQERYLKALHLKLERMQQELSCRATPLPELFSSIAGEDALSDVFCAVARTLALRNSQDAPSCMGAVLQEFDSIPEPVKAILSQLGDSLGCFDLDGQLQQLQSVTDECRRSLDRLAQGRDVRLRNYQTFGFCAGAALALLLL